MPSPVPAVRHRRRRGHHRRARPAAPWPVRGRAAGLTRDRRVQFPRRSTAIAGALFVDAGPAPEGSSGPSRTARYRSGPRARRDLDGGLSVARRPARARPDARRVLAGAAIDRVEASRSPCVDARPDRVRRSVSRWRRSRSGTSAVGLLDGRDGRAACRVATADDRRRRARTRAQLDEPTLGAAQAPPGSADRPGRCPGSVGCAGAADRLPEPEDPVVGARRSGRRHRLVAGPWPPRPGPPKPLAEPAARAAAAAAPATTARRRWTRRRGRRPCTPMTMSTVTSASV